MSEHLFLWALSKLEKRIGTKGHNPLHNPLELLDASLELRQLFVDSPSSSITSIVND